MSEKSLPGAVVIDTSAILAILFQEAEAEMCSRAMASASGRFVSAVSFLEAAMVLRARRGEDGIADLYLLIETAALDIVPFGHDDGLAALDAFTRFGKGRHPAGLNMGDCASYALAASRGLPLLFKGDDFSRTDIGRVL